MSSNSLPNALDFESTQVIIILKKSLEANPTNEALWLLYLYFMSFQYKEGERSEESKDAHVQVFQQAVSTIPSSLTLWMNLICYSPHAATLTSQLSKYTSALANLVSLQIQNGEQSNALFNFMMLSTMELWNAGHYEEVFAVLSQLIDIPNDKCSFKDHPLKYYEIPFLVKVKKLLKPEDILRVLVVFIHLLEVGLFPKSCQMSFTAARSPIERMKSGISRREQENSGIYWHEAQDELLDYYQHGFQLIELWQESSSIQQTKNNSSVTSTYLCTLVHNFVTHLLSYHHHSSTSSSTKVDVEKMYDTLWDNSKDDMMTEPSVVYHLSCCYEQLLYHRKGEQIIDQVFEHAQEQADIDPEHGFEYFSECMHYCYLFRAKHAGDVAEIVSTWSAMAIKNHDRISTLQRNLPKVLRLPCIDDHEALDQTRVIRNYITSRRYFEHIPSSDTQPLSCSSAFGPMMFSTKLAQERQISEALDYLERILNMRKFHTLPVTTRRQVWLQRLRMELEAHTSMTQLKKVLDRCFNTLSAQNITDDEEELVKVVQHGQKKKHVLSTVIQDYCFGQPRAHYLAPKDESSHWEYALVRVVFQHISVDKHERLYSSLLSSCRSLRLYSCDFIMDFADFCLVRHASLEPAAKVIVQCRCPTASPSFVKYLVSTELCRGRPGRALERIHASLNENPFSASVWKQLLQLEILYGADSSRLDVLVHTMFCMGISIHECLLGDEWIAEDSIWTSLVSSRTTDLKHDIDPSPEPSSGLNVSHAQLYFFPQSIVSSYRNIPLTHINLSHNCLVMVPPALFGDLPHLTSLDVSYNSLVHLPTSIGQATNLQTLNCAHNHLQRLPDQIGQCRALASMNLNANLLSALPPSLHHCRNLTRLYVAFNNLQPTKSTKMITWKCEINVQGNIDLQKKNVSGRVYMHRNLGACALCKQGQGRTQYLNTMILCPNCIVSALRTEL